MGEFRETADVARAALNVVDERVVKHARAAVALAVVPRGASPQEVLCLLEDARTVWRTRVPPSGVRKPRSN